MTSGSAGGPRAERPALKGMELVSWRKGDSWHFSLLEGTNRSKSADEITAAGVTLSGVDALKSRLSKLAKGESVVWVNPVAAAGGPQFAYPDGQVVKDLQEFCQSLEMELAVPPE